MRLGTAEVVWTGRGEGDMAPAAPAARQRWRSVVDRRLTWLHQVHGATVVTVAEPGGQAGADADAVVTAHPQAALAIFTADCAPVALVSPEGVLGAAHVGWRGLVAGVLEAAVAAMRAGGASRVDGALGPCIGPECYEFSAADLDVVAGRYGDDVRATTADGGAALDLRAGVRAALTAQGVNLVHSETACTACGVGWFSHRARRERERQAMVVWTP